MRREREGRERAGREREERERGRERGWRTSRRERDEWIYTAGNFQIIT